MLSMLAKYYIVNPPSRCNYKQYVSGKLSSAMRFQDHESA